MSRMVLTVIAVGVVLCCASCGTDGASQPINVSGFDDFTFSRTIERDNCFEPGDLLSMTMVSQIDNRRLDFTTLTASDQDGAECLAHSPEGVCLVAAEPASRVLVPAENSKVSQLFGRVMIASKPNDFCAAGNITMCSDDLYMWDGLTVSGDFCEPVHVYNGYEVMSLLEELRDGPPAEPEPSSFNFFDLGNSVDTTPVDILRSDPIMASDQFLGKNGDYVVIRRQSDLDGVLLQDGSATIDFSSEIGVAVVVIRAPCQEFTGVQAVQSTLTVDISGTMARNQDCSFDLGSIEAYLIVIPTTPKKIRLFLNGSELDEIHL